MTSVIEQTGAAVLRFAAGIMAADQGQIAAAAAPDITWAVPGSRQGQRDVPRARQGTALARGPRVELSHMASVGSYGWPGIYGTGWYR